MCVEKRREGCSVKDGQGKELPFYDTRELITQECAEPHGERRATL